jgi:hypothetical protein
MAKRKNDTSETVLTAWDGKKTVDFPADFAPQTKLLVEDYLRKTIAMGAEFTPKTRAEFFRESLSKLGTTLEETTRQALGGSLTELHRAAVEMIFRRWMAGETSFKAGDIRLLPEANASQVKKLTALFERTTIRHYEFHKETREARSHWSQCDFTIGAWEARATWQVSEEENLLELTDFEDNEDEDSLSGIEERVQSGLSREFLGAFLYLIAFDLINDEFDGRPTAEDYPLLFPEDE